MKNEGQTRRMEENYAKLGAILEVLDSFSVSEDTRAALLWVARDYLETLGQIIGINSPTQP